MMRSRRAQDGASNTLVKTMKSVYAIMLALVANTANSGPNASSVAHAEEPDGILSAAWSCGEIHVRMYKYATDTFELRFGGDLRSRGQLKGRGVHFNYAFHTDRSRDWATLNGKPCRVLPLEEAEGKP